ncbi:hypothetical protein ACPEER_04455 [Pasteurella sp. PK-2025]|uniref:hypothetical protein n=1 Tax=Pasteurella sp. PK-2025 TaxID=3413133 RepID=UPI003C792989
MKSKYWIIFFVAMSLTQCIDVASFQPPARYFKWRAPDYPHLNKYPEEERFYQWVVHRGKEMRACGMDPFDGESNYPEVNLCLERKGWYLEEGPYCENELEWNKPLCVEWRKKHSKPDAKPWSPKRE